MKEVGKWWDKVGKLSTPLVRRKTAQNDGSTYELGGCRWNEAKDSI